MQNISVIFFVTFPICNQSEVHITYTYTHTQTHTLTHKKYILNKMKWT